MPGRSSPHLARRQLGLILRGYREARHEPAKDVAEALDLTASDISRIETGARRPGMSNVRVLCQYYGLDQQTTDRLIGMARESQQGGWWASYDLESDASTYISLETGASASKNFELAFVPGLLQTSDYARAVLAPIHPDWTEQRLGQAVESRIARQQSLRSDSPIQFHAILDESALHRPIGGPAVMREQLDQLITMSALPNVAVQVLPFSVGSNVGLEGSFSILTFAGKIPEAIVTEGPLGTNVQEKKEVVTRLRQTFDQLAELAADGPGSVKVIQQCIRQFSGIKTRGDR